jgi:gas vesicle protein
MSAKIANLRKAAERPIQLARMAAVGTVAIIVVGGVALVVVRARRRAELRTLRGRARTLAEAAAGAAADPRKTAKRARKGAEKAVDDTKDQLREQLRKELADQMKDSRPLHEKILTGAAQSAASAAIPIVLRKIQERVETAPAAAKRS